jgi:hypothetical protein
MTRITEAQRRILIGGPTMGFGLGLSFVTPDRPWAAFALFVLGAVLFLAGLWKLEL